MSEWLFEHHHRGEVWRLEIQTYRGCTSANMRKWYRTPAGEWNRTKIGFTFPLCKLREFTADLMEHHGIEPPDTLRTGT